MLVVPRLEKWLSLWVLQGFNESNCLLVLCKLKWKILTITVHNMQTNNELISYCFGRWNFELSHCNNTQIRIQMLSLIFSHLHLSHKYIYTVLCLSRRNNKFRVFGGLWFGEEKPFFSTFLKPFVNTLQETEINSKLQFWSNKLGFYISCGS